MAFDGDGKELRTTLASYVLTINTQPIDAITVCESHSALWLLDSSLNTFATSQQAAENDWADDVEDVRSLFGAHACSLHMYHQEQSEASMDLASWEHYVGAMRESIYRLQTQDPKASVNRENRLATRNS